MRIEQGPPEQQLQAEVVLSAEEKEEKERALAEKLPVEAAVMREMGFLPLAKDKNNLEIKTESSEEELAAYVLWTTDVGGEKDTSDAAIFNVVYTNMINTPGKLELLRKDPDEIIKEIVVQMTEIKNRQQ